MSEPGLEGLTILPLGYRMITVSRELWARWLATASYTVRRCADASVYQDLADGTVLAVESHDGRTWIAESSLTRKS